jgi:hypothetical protein
VVAFSSLANAAKRHREYANTAQNRCRPPTGSPVDDQVFPGCPHRWPATALVLFPLQPLCLGDKACGNYGPSGRNPQATGSNRLAEMRPCDLSTRAVTNSVTAS